MRKLRDGWRAVELLGARPGPRAEWQLHARLDFDVIGRYLRPHGGRLSRHYPCPRCGRAFRAEDLGDGKAVAFPDEDDGHVCPEVFLTHEDLAEWVCDAAALHTAIAGGLRLDGAAAVADAARGLVHLGTRALDGERVPVVLCIQSTAPLYCAAANAWLARQAGAGVFLSVRACSPLISIFDGKPDAVGSLEDLLGLDGEPGFLCEKAFERMVRRVAEAGACGADRRPVNAVGRTDVAAVAAVAEAKDVIIGEVRDLKGVVIQALDEGDQRQSVSERRRMMIEDMSAGPDRFLSGLAARINNEKTRVLLLALMEKVNDDGRERYLTYAEIGERIGGISKQAIGARVTRLRLKYPGPWDYVEGLREPEKAARFSEISPSERRKRGIDESYNYDAR